MRLLIFRNFALFLLVIASQISAAYDPPQTDEDWSILNKRIINDLNSQDIEDKIYGLKQIIHYGRQLDVESAKYDILVIFLTNENPKYRQLALLALYHICNCEDIELISKQLKVENDPQIRQRIQAIIRERELNKNTQPPDLHNTFVRNE